MPPYDTQLLLEMLVSGDGGLRIDTVLRHAAAARNADQWGRGLGIDTALRHAAAARNAGQWDESVVRKLERLIALFNIQKSCCGDYFVLRCSVL